MNRFFPYPTIHEPLPLVAESQTVDGEEPAVDLLAAQKTINVSAIETGWRRVTVRLRLEVPRDATKDVRDISATLTVNCPATNLRWGVALKPGARLGTYVGELEIEPGALARRASVRAVVSATIGGVPDRYYGQSDVWTVWIDPPEVPLLSGDLEVKWEDFGGETCPPGIDSAFRKHAYYVDVTADPPVIWLNEGVADLRRLFDDSARRSPAEKALRTAHFHGIAASGWLAMFNASLGSISQDGEGSVSWPTVEWQRQVLLELLPRIYPDLSSEDSLQRAYEDDQDRDGARLLQSRAMAAIEGILQSTRAIRHSIKALEDEQ